MCENSSYMHIST